VSRCDSATLACNGSIIDHCHNTSTVHRGENEEAAKWWDHALETEGMLDKFSQIPLGEGSMLRRISTLVCFGHLHIRCNQYCHVVDAAIEWVVHGWLRCT
jgi:hypothetical protein